MSAKKNFTDDLTVHTKSFGKLFFSIPILPMALSLPTFLSSCYILSVQSFLLRLLSRFGMLFLIARSLAQNGHLKLHLIQHRKAYVENIEYSL